MSGRPRLSMGTYGSIHVVQKGRGRFTAHTRYRDIDGRLRQVRATSTSRSNAVSELKTRQLTRPGYGRGGTLSLPSPFTDLAELWLADLAQREISEGTRQNYRDDLRVHVRPLFEHLHTRGDHHRQGRDLLEGRTGDVGLAGQACAHHAQPPVRVPRCVTTPWPGTRLRAPRR